MVEPYDNADQAAFWSEGAGRKWIDEQAAMDAALAPVLDLLLGRAALRPGQRVLDIGCGTGTSTIEIAGRVAPGGEAHAVDIAAALLETAQSRAARVPNAEFTLADAQTHGFAQQSYDIALSRFGVMFFSDPAAAFANIARALKPGAPLIFAAWCSVADNPWFRLPARVAMQRLGKVTPTPPRAPGPMAFEEADYVTDILTRAGLEEISVTRADLHLTPLGTPADVAALAMRIGPATRIIAEREGTPADAAAIEAAIAEAMAGFDTGRGVRVPAAIQLCTARAPA